jgi:hypothetical protein
LGVLTVGLLCGGFVSAQPAGFRSQVFLSDGSAFNDPNSPAGFQDLRAQGGVTRTEAGSSVVFGNFNGDAFQDIAIGVRKSNQVLVYFGRLVLDPNDSSLGASAAFVIEPGLAAGAGGPDVVITCPSCQTGSNNSDFGFSLATGDVNGDGRHDLIVGAPFDDDGGTDRGRAFVVLGRASWSATVSVDGDPQTYKLTTGGTNGNGYFLGFAVAAGDFDGDGRADVAVSSRNADRRSTGGIFDPSPNLVDTGAIHLFRSTGLPAPPATIPANGAGVISIAGERGSDFLGEHMAFCNVDNDLDSGFPSMDLLVGAIGVDNPDNVQTVTNAGAVYVFRGQALKTLAGGPANATTPSTSAVSSIFGAEKDDSLGFSVACGDIDGDGFDDPAAGAFFAGANINRRGGGEVYVFYGGSPLGSAAFPALRNLRKESVGPPAEPDLHPDDSDLVIFPATGSDQLGFGLTMGDLDGDGLLDIVASARRYDADATAVDGGITYAIRGSSTRPRDMIIDLQQGTAFDPNNSSDRPDFPTAHGDNPLISCSAATPNDPANPCAVMAILMGRAAYSQSGFSVGAGDFNGDGFDEVMVGAIGDPARLTTYGGRAYVASLTDVDTDGVSDLSDEDNDNDCLADADEPSNGTDRFDEDSDDDGLQDGTELGVQSVTLRGEFVSPACPANAGAPCCRLDLSPSSTSDPLDPDTDGDCIPDGCIATGGFPNAGPCPPPGAGPHLQGEDANLDGARDTTEPDATLLDTDGDGLPDGLEWGVTALACTFLGTNPTSPVLKTDADPATTTNPSADDTDGGGALDGDEDVNLDGRRDFDPATFTCGANPALDVNNETDPADRTDDRAGFLRPEQRRRDGLPPERDAGGPPHRHRREQGSGGRGDDHDAPHPEPESVEPARVPGAHLSRRRSRRHDERRQRVDHAHRDGAEHGSVPGHGPHDHLAGIAGERDVELQRGRPDPRGVPGRRRPLRPADESRRRDPVADRDPHASRPDGARHLAAHDRRRRLRSGDRVCRRGRSLHHRQHDVRSVRRAGRDFQLRAHRVQADPAEDHVRIGPCRRPVHGRDGLRHALSDADRRARVPGGLREAVRPARHGPAGVLRGISLR